jgi:hypothetical protein
MDEVTAARTLDFFSGRTSIKGPTTLDKLNNLMQRWEKVIEDCNKSSDQSQYKVQFSDAHKAPLSSLKKILQEIKTEEEAKSISQSLAYRFKNNLLQYPEYTGYADALAFIILELKQCS